MTEHLDIGLDAEQAVFRRRKLVAPGQKVACDGLGVSTNKGTPGMERLAKKIVRERGFGCADSRRRLTG